MWCIWLKFLKCHRYCHKMASSRGLPIHTIAAVVGMINHKTPLFQRANWWVKRKGNCPSTRVWFKTFCLNLLKLWLAAMTSSSLLLELPSKYVSERVHKKAGKKEKPVLDNLRLSSGRMPHLFSQCTGRGLFDISGWHTNPHSLPSVLSVLKKFKV